LEGSYSVKVRVFEFVLNNLSGESLKEKCEVNGVFAVYDKLKLLIIY